MKKYLILLLLIASLNYAQVTTSTGVSRADKGLGTKVIEVGTDSRFSYNTVDAAVNVASPGDMIMVAPGTYTGHIDADVANITIKSLEGPNRTTLALVMASSAGLELNGDGIVIDGFTLIGDAAGTLIEIQQSSDGLIIENCIINSTGSATFGLVISTSGASDCIVRDNTFLTNSGDGAMWANKTVDNFRIYGNTFLGRDSTSGYAIQCGGGFNNWFIHNNVIRAEDGFAGGFASGIFMYAGATSANSDSVYIHHNDIAECSKGVRIGHSSMTLTVSEFYVHENTIHNNQKGVFISADAQNDPSTFIINANSFWDNALFDIENAHATALAPGAMFNESGIDLTGTATNQIKFIVNNDPTNPNVEITPGTGFYASSVNNLRFASEGSAVLNFAPTSLDGNKTGSFSLKNSTATSTVPTMCANKTDLNTGEGWANPDQKSSIVGGVEGQRISEGNGEISTIISGTVVETITDATSAGDATLTKVGENFDVTCSIGDAVLIYGGTTVGDYGTYFIESIAATILTLDRALAGSDADVDFNVLADGVVIENSTTGVAVIHFPGYTRHVDIDIGAATLGPTAPTAVTVGTFRGFGFDADNESAFVNFEIPSDWDRASDITVELHWYPTAGDVVANGETVKWDMDYRSIAAGEAMDNGTVVSLTATLTGGASETDKEHYETALTLDFDNVNQPITAGDDLGIQFDRDVSGDTYSGAGIVYRIDLSYTSIRLPEH